MKSLTKKCLLSSALLMASTSTLASNVPSYVLSCKVEQGATFLDEMKPFTIVQIDSANLPPGTWAAAYPIQNTKNLALMASTDGDGEIDLSVWQYVGPTRNGVYYLSNTSADDKDISGEFSANPNFSGYYGGRMSFYVSTLPTQPDGVFMDVHCLIKRVEPTK